MPNNLKLISGRVVVTSAANVAADRYQYLDLSSAEPNLGTANVGDVLVYDSAFPGGRKWIPQGDIAGSIGQSAYVQANTASANTLYLSGVDLTQNANITHADTKAQAAFDSANTKLSTSGGTITGTLTVNGEAGVTGNLIVTNTLTVGTLNLPDALTSNVSLFTGINTTQNTNITIADTKAQGAFDQANATNNLTQSAFNKANSANVLAQAAFDYANTILSLDNNIDQTARNTANSAEANTIYTQGVDVTQNTRITIIEGVNTWQNTEITNINSLAQNAFNTANAANSIANASATNEFTQSAFNKANSANVLAQAAFDYANTLSSSGSSIDQFARNTANNASANTIYTQGVDVTQNTNITNLSSWLDSNVSIISGINTTQNTNITNVDTKAQGAFDSSNTKLSTSGGTITGSLNVSQDLAVTGNLTVLGTLTTINTSSFAVNDSLIQLSVGNYTSDLLDIGFSGHYNNGTNAHTGFIRDHGTKEWYVFEGYTPELSANNNIDINHDSFAKANVHADYFKGNVITSGYNVFDFAQAAYNTANTKLATSGGTITGTLTVNGEVGITGNLVVSGTSVLTTLNSTTANIASLANVNVSQNTTIQAAFDKANTVSTDVSNFTSLFSAIENTQNTRITAVESLSQLAFNKANSANVLAQAAFDFANTGGASAAIASALANAAFIQANTVTITSQAAFDQANTAANSNIYINGVDLTQNTRIGAAYNQANVATILAQDAFNKANTVGAGIDQVARDTANAAFATANAATGNLTSYSETTVSPTISGGTLTFDLSQGTTFNVAINAAISTLNITNPAATGRTSSALVVFNYNGVSYSVTWPGSFRWPGGVAPALTNTNGKRDIFTFFTMDGGNTYIAIISAQNV